MKGGYMQGIKYHYALNSQCQIVDISSVTENNRKEKYYCLNCGKEMRPRLGKKNAHHFAHITVATLNCNPETYLHKLAKLKIKEKFFSSTPFEISISQATRCSSRKNCPFYKDDRCRSVDYMTYDLHEHYDMCEEERTIGNFRADLLLTSSVRSDIPPVFIEIRVSHKCDNVKLNSGYRIIEVGIKTEGDIVKLLESPLVGYDRCSLDNDSVTCTFHNFKSESSDSELSMRSIPKFYLYDSGAAHVHWWDGNCRDVLRKDKMNAILELAIDMVEVPFYGVSLYDIGYAKSANLGYDILPNCHLCKYLKGGSGFFPYQNICCLYKKCGTPKYPESGKEALDCPYYSRHHRNDKNIRSVLERVTIIECR